MEFIIAPTLEHVWHLVDGGEIVPGGWQRAVCGAEVPTNRFGVALDGATAVRCDQCWSATGAPKAPSAPTGTRVRDGQ